MPHRKDQVQHNLSLFFLSITASIFFAACSESTSYPKIEDLFHPTLKDYQALQRYLEKGERPNIELLADFKGRSKIKMLGKKRGEIPQRGVITVNSKESEKENCLILYATWNKKYRFGLKSLADQIAASDFKGDILYRIGGWPNCEAGDFALAHVPYAFKVCFFREAQRLGYKRALWLDCSILPLVSLNHLFKIIEKQGYLAMGNSFMVGPFFNEKAAQFYKIPFQETFQIPSCSSGIFGLDFTQSKPMQALNMWYEAAQDPYAYYSARPDQNSLSLILHLLGMKEWLNIDTLSHGKEKIHKDSLFLIERELVQGESKLVKQK